MEGRMGNTVYLPGRPAIGVPPTQGRAIPQDSGAVAKIGVFLLAIYVFVIYSRALEVFGIGTVTAVLLTLLVPCSILSGNVFRFASQSTGRLLIAYTAWFCLAVGMSSWRGGSFEIFTHRTGRAVLLYIVVVALISRKRDFMRLIWAIALGNLFLVCRALLHGEQQEGRLVVGGGTFGDPNELAMYAIFGMFLWFLIAVRLPRFLRFLPLGAVGLALLAFGKTGSRGGFIAITIAGVAHFWNSSLATKVRVAAATLVLLVLASFVLPEYIRTRFTTFFSADSDSKYGSMLEGNDVGSTLSRQEVAGQAFQLTLQHPVFGIGPGEFGNTMYQKYKVGAGQFVNQAAHNSYLQISSETGIPGALLFIGALLTCLFQKPKYAAATGRSNPRRAGPSGANGKLDPESAVMIHFARVALLVVVAFGISLSFAYDDIFMLAMALLTAAVNVANNESAAAAIESYRSGQTPVTVPR
jgi:O-antigen ligase